MFHAVYALSVVNLRLFMVYGPGQIDAAKLVPYVVTSLLADVSPQLSSGSRPVDWVYVSDVVDALVAAASATTGDDGTPIDIGSGSLVSIRDFVRQIAWRVDGRAELQFGALRDREHEAVVAAELRSGARTPRLVPSDNSGRRAGRNRGLVRASSRRLVGLVWCGCRTAATTRRRSVRTAPRVKDRSCISCVTGTAGDCAPA